MRYVTTRYLARMRPTLVRNLAMVIVKGLVQKNVPGWEGKETRLLSSLTAIARARPEVWDSIVRDVPVRLFPTLDDDQRLRAYLLLGFEPRFWQHAEEDTRTQFTALIDHLDDKPDGVTAFSALGIKELREPLIRAFDRADRQRKITIISRYPHPCLLDGAIDLLRGARDYRGAEARFQGAITPLVEVVDEAAVARILEATKENEKVWDAGDVPEMLADFASSLSQRRKLVATPWQDLVAFYVYRRRETAVGIIGTRLRSLGVVVPTELPDQEK